MKKIPDAYRVKNKLTWTFDTAESAHENNLKTLYEITFEIIF